MTEREQILTALKNCRRIDLYVDPVSLSPEETAQLEQILARRRTGEPLQYILGSCEFLGVSLKVDSRALVPRPETELVVDKILDLSRKLPDERVSVLDIGTGSGNIAIALAVMTQNLFLTAVDVSCEALVLAGENAHRNGVANRIEFVESDLFSNLKNHLSNQRLFDIIVSNPPYVPTSQIAFLPVDVRREPRLALDGGVDGLDFYRRIINESHLFLRPRGLLVLEIGDDQLRGISEIVAKSGNYYFLDYLKDFNQKDRIVILERIHG